MLSLDLSHTTQQYMTTCVLDHDVVSRASLANFEQLRLEVLASGWWNGLVDPVVKSSAFEKVLGTLEATGAHQLIGLLAWEADTDSGAEAAATGGASTSTGAPVTTTGAPSTALGARGGGGSGRDVNYAMENLHQLYAKPTVCSSSFIGTCVMPICLEILCHTARQNITYNIVVRLVYLRMPERWQYASMV